MLNYAFDPAIVNPVSARVGQQVMGGIRFAGVDGAPNRPWKLDKNNWQARGGMAYQINEKTVLRAGYGKYFLNPTSQGNNAGFSLATDVITSTDGGRNPTSLLSNPWPNGIQTPPGSASGRGNVPRSRSQLLEPRLRRAERPPVLSGRSARAAVEDLPRGHLCGKPQLWPGSRFRRLQRTVGGVPGAVRRDPGRQPYVVRPDASEPVPRRRWLRGHDPVHERYALAVRTEPPVPGVCWHHQEPEQHRQADLRLGAVRGEQAHGEGRDHQRQLYVCGEVERGRRLRRRGLGTAERYRVFLAPPTSHHRVRRVGVALVPERAQYRGIPPWRLVDLAGVRLPVRPAVGHARQRRSGGGRQTATRSRWQARRKGSSSTA